MEAERKEVLSHFPEISKETIEFATNTALEDSKYIFVTAGKIKKAYCTHCNKKYQLLDKIKQNATGVCKKCGSRATYKYKGMGRAYLSDAAEFLWFEKSKVNKNIVVASWINCRRDYSGSYEDVKTECVRVRLYIFEMGGSGLWELPYWNKERLEKRKTVFTTLNTNLRKYISEASVKNAIRNTPFEKSGWEKYSNEKWIEYLALYSEKPNIEALTKGGHVSVVETKLNGLRSYRAINWNATKLHEFFKVSKNDYKMIMKDKNGNEPVWFAGDRLLSLYLWQQVRKNKEKIKYEEVDTAVHSLRLERYLDEFNLMRKYTSITKAINYCKRQFKVDAKNYGSAGQVLVIWKDYINDLKHLRIELDHESMFPRNLFKMHERTMKMVKIKNDELANMEIKKRSEELTKFEMEHKGLIIRPPMTFKEIVQEGKRLNHCVGSYAKQHAKGSTTLLFVRKKESPDEPYYTVEVKNNNVHQVRGKRNKVATEDVDELITMFKETKLKNKKGSVAV